MRAVVYALFVFVSYAVPFKAIIAILLDEVTVPVFEAVVSGAERH